MASRRKKNKSPIDDSRRLVGNQLQAPVIDWNAPPKIVVFPEIEDLKKLSLAQLNKITTSFGITSTWAELEQDVRDYIPRITRRKWTKQALQAEMQRLMDIEEQSGVRKFAKRAYREYGIVQAVSGAKSLAAVEWIWIVDGGDNTCDGCMEHAGQTGTIASFGTRPGAQTCYGGEECQCQLIRLA